MAWSADATSWVTASGQGVAMGIPGTGRLLELTIFTETDTGALSGLTLANQNMTLVQRILHTNGGNSVEVWIIGEDSLPLLGGTETLVIPGWTSNMIALLSRFASDYGLSSYAAHSRGDQSSVSSTTVLDATTSAGKLVTFSALSSSSSQSVDTWPSGMTETSADALTGILQFGQAYGVVDAGFTPPAGDDYTVGFSGSTGAAIGSVVVYTEAAAPGGGGGGGGLYDSPVGTAQGQYGVGRASFTNGSAVVTGTGTEWTAGVSAGDLISRTGSSVMYEIQSVDSDAQLTLVSAWMMPTETDRTYAITRDFTANHGLPLVSQADFATSGPLARSLAGIDGIIQDLKARAP